MLPENVFPIFPAKFIFTMYGISVTRLKILMTPGFAITDYKVQGTTFQTAVLDLHRHSKSKDKDSHKRFCSNYVQLFRLQIFDGVGLLQLITLNDIESKLHSKLQNKSLKIDNWSDQTLLFHIYQFNQQRLV